MAGDPARDDSADNGGSTGANSPGGTSPGANPSGEASTATDGGSSIAARLGTLFLSSIPRILGTVVLALVLLGVIAFAAGVVGVPTVEGLSNEFVAVNDSTTVIGSDLTIHNPNPIDAAVLGVSGEYAIEMNDVHMADGSTGPIELAPGNSTLELRTYLDNDRIPAWWVSHVQRGEETTVRVNATVESDLLGKSVPIEQTQTIETDILSSFNSTETRPIDADHVLVEDPVLYVNETRAKWGEVSRDRTAIVLDFYIYNPKSYAIPLSKLNYTIDMNDVRVGAGSNTEAAVLPPKELTRVRTVTYIRNDNLDEWWVTHLERNQVTDVRIDFDAAVEISGTNIQVPLDRMTHNETFETDVFGTKDDTPPETGDGAVGDGADDGNETDGGADDGTTGDDGTSTGGDGTTTGDDGTTTGDDGTSTGDDGTTTDDGPLPAKTPDRSPTYSVVVAG
jgi:LEA14-like dessication related protein